MNLITKTLLKQFPTIGKTAHITPDKIKIIAKFFTPDSFFSWYATEYDSKTHTFYGYVIGQQEELGYFDLDELKSLKGKLGLPVERDLYFEATLEEVLSNKKK